jgi:hypothetical protein
MRLGESGVFVHGDDIAVVGMFLMALKRRDGGYK